MPPATRSTGADFSSAWRGWGRPWCGAWGAAASSRAACFAQISDSHIGFSKEPNRDVTGTLQLAVDRMNRLKSPPQLLLHTGDLTHLSKPAEFDAVDQILRGAKAGRTF